MNYIDTFERVEHKYLMSTKQAHQFYEQIEQYMQEDIYIRFILSITFIMIQMITG